MVCHRTISQDLRDVLSRSTGIHIKALIAMTGVSRRHIYRLRKKNTVVKQVTGGNKVGRPRKISVHDVRRILREVTRLRGTFPNWTAKTLMNETNLKVYNGVNKDKSDIIALLYKCVNRVY